MGDISTLEHNDILPLISSITPFPPNNHGMQLYPPIPFLLLLLLLAPMCTHPSFPATDVRFSSCMAIACSSRGVEVEFAQLPVDDGF